MSLINIQTNLKSLKFDKQGANSAPYVVTDIENAEPTRGTLGVYGALAKHKAQDIQRVASFLADPTKGPLFIAKQTLLAQTQVQGQGDTRRRGPTPIDILGQTTVQGTGVHITTVDEQKTYQKTVGIESNEEPENNRLVLLKSALFTNSSTPLPSNTDVILGDPSVSQTGEALQVLEYKGGPQSVGGLGKTVIKRSVNSRRIVYNDTGKRINYTDDQKTPNDVTRGETFLVAKSPYQFNYNNPKIRKESRLNEGDPGGIEINKRQWRKDGYKIVNFDKVDKINFTPELRYNSEFLAGATGDENVGRDIIKFRFEVITPETINDPHVLLFRAFLDDISDQYSGQWSDTRYIGRAESFKTYSGFDRQMSFGFTMAAMTRAEMIPLYRKIVYLASTTAPTYANEDSIFMNGTFVRLTIGNYVYRQAGYITNVSYNIDQQTPWEIAMTDPEENNNNVMQELPHMLKVQIGFTPLHEFTPRTGLHPYITRAKNSGVDQFTYWLDDDSKLFERDYTPLPSVTGENFRTHKDEKV